MSQNESTSEGASEEQLQQYRSTSGVETKTADIPNDDHDLKDVIGDGDDAQERIYDSRIAGERFVNFYDDTAAGLREFLSNAETACIDRCEAELEKAGCSVPSSVSEKIEKAKKETNYNPVIEVTYNRDPNATTLIIEDNGIGISRERYQVLQRVGYSTSHDDGGSAGQFGIGFLAGFLLCGVHEGFDLLTHSFEDEAQYHTVEFLGNFEYGSEMRESYGTTFRFNTFCHKAKQEVNVPNAVQKYSEGLRVPVIYTDYDENGKETGRSDDYTPRNIEDDYPDDAMVITYEDEFVKAVMSPSSSNTRGKTTYNVIMDIRRNLDTYKTKCGAPWEWDVRVKTEDGCIVDVDDDVDLPEWADSGDELIGLSPIDDQKYPGLTEHQQEDAIKRSELPQNDVVTAPRPASSRDSFKAGNDDFWKHVASKLSEQWQQEAAAMLDGLDSFGDYVDLDAGDKSLVNRAYSDYGPDTTRSNNEDDKSRAATINDALSDSLGISLDTDVAVKLDQLKYKTRLVPRGTDEPRLKGNSGEEKIWKIIDKAAGDDIYMGKSITDKKAEIAWGLSDNTQVVRVEDYAKWEDLFGWKKLKDLPARNLDEKLPSLDQDVIDRWNNTTTSNKTSGSDDKRTSRDPTTKYIKVRCDAGDSDYFDKHSAGKVYDALEDGKSISCGRWSKHSATALIIFDQNETSRAWAVANAANYRRNVAAAKMPTYVYDYLKQADNVYESKAEYKRACARETIELGTGINKRLCDLHSNDLLVVTPDSFEEQYGDQMQLVKEHVCDRTNVIDADSVLSTTLIRSSDMSENIYGFEKTDATVIRLSEANTSRTVRRKCDGKVSLNTGRLYLETELPDADFDSDEFSYIFGTETPKDTEAFRNTVELIKQAGGSFPSQDE